MKITSSKNDKFLCLNYLNDLRPVFGSYLLSKFVSRISIIIASPANVILSGSKCPP